MTFAEALCSLKILEVTLIMTRINNTIKKELFGTGIMKWSLQKTTVYAKRRALTYHVITKPGVGARTGLTLLPSVTQ